MDRRRTRWCSPTVEGLESLRLLSTMQPIAVVAAPRHQGALATIKGIEGTYLVTRDNPDFGHTTRLAGSTEVAGLGRVPFTGNLNGTGFIARGRAGGSLTYAGQSGSLVITLSGPVQAGFAGLPSQFKYQVTKATGEFRGVTGSGTSKLVLDDSGHFSMSLAPGISRKR